VSAVVDQVKDRQLLETRSRAFGLTEPGEELLQIVTVAAHCSWREIVAAKTADEIGKPAIRGFPAPLNGLYAMWSPALDTRFVA
jgi:hypothetical protein